MAVYVANFGTRNYEWPECLRRGTIAVNNEADVQHLWAAGDKDAYIAIQTSRPGPSGQVPTPATAGRWYKAMTTVNRSVGDIWIHRDGPYLWWTRSIAAPASFENKIEPVPPHQEVVVCHKPCEPWRNRSEKGATLLWDALHPKARDFLYTTATLQELSPENAAYAMALIQGENLDPWHTLQDWQKKSREAKGKNTGGRVFSGMERAVCRMVDTAWRTCAAANGQAESRVVRNKDFGFDNRAEGEAYVRALVERQELRCAITKLTLSDDDPAGDPQMRASLDRINSSGHYEDGNLQVVCAFINRWKGADDDKEFRRLIDILMGR